MTADLGQPVEQSITQDDCKSPDTITTSVSATRAVESCRHFKKTRSFSAVEETPEQLVTSERLSAIPDLPRKEAAHSRSERLETQSLNQENAGLDPKTMLIASSNTIVDDNSESAQIETSRRQNDIISGVDDCDNTLIMQFDYFSEDQPMSLQHDPRFDAASTCGKRGAGSQFHESGRDLTELESDVVRSGFGRAKNNRMNSRPRLELLTFL